VDFTAYLVAGVYSFNGAISGTTPVQGVFTFENPQIPGSKPPKAAKSAVIGLWIVGTGETAVGELFK